MDSTTTQPKKKREMLTSFSIIFILLILVALISVAIAPFVPGITAVTVGDFFMSPVKGFGDALGVCLFVLVIGGFLGIVNKTDALNTGISVLVKNMKGNELKLIPILMALFALGGSTYGMCEETVGFYALLSATMMAAGYDSLTGAMIVLLGAGVGCLGSTVNPFCTGVAASALVDKGITVDQGVIIGLGAVLLVVSYVIAVFFTMQYAKSVKADPSRTLMSLDEVKAADEVYRTEEDETNKDVALTIRQKISLWIFAITFVIMIISFIPWTKLGVNFFECDAASHDEVTQVAPADLTKTFKEKELGELKIEGNANFSVKKEVVDNAGWSSLLTGVPLGQWYFPESTTWFLLMAIVIGVVGGLSEHEIVDSFMRGSGEIISVAMIIAVSRAVSVLMSSTGLADWILNSSSDALSGTSGVIFSVGAYFLYFVLSFLIPSTSGMATVSMPIMGPLAQNLGFNPAVMVMIFASASGVVNLFTPTNGAIMGGLALSRIEYGTWLKFVVRVVVAIVISNLIILSVALMVLR